MNDPSRADRTGVCWTSENYIVSGTLSLDTLHLPSGVHYDVPGGSALFAALGASLVRGCAMVGSVGHDFPHRILTSLTQRGVDVGGVVRRDGPTFRWKAQYTADLAHRTTLDRVMGAGNTPPAVPQRLVEPTPCVLLGSMSPVHQAAVLAEAGPPARYGIDTMAHWIREERDTLDGLLPRASVVFVSQDECSLLGQDSDPFRAAQRLIAEGTAVVVLKTGAGGAYLIQDQSSPIHCPAVDASLVDPTGAGDALAGAFMAASSLGLDERMALASGVAAAAIVLEGVGCVGFAAASLTFDARVQWALAQIESDGSRKTNE